MTKSNTNPDDLGGLANQLTNEFGNLADEAKYAAVTAENNEVSDSKLCSSHLFFSETVCLIFHYLDAQQISVFVCFQIGSNIKKQVGELGLSCTGLVTKAGALQCSPNDSFTKKELIESARKVSEKVGPQPNTSLCLSVNFWGVSFIFVNFHFIF